MIFKKRGLKTTAAAIAIFSMVASSGITNLAHADSSLSGQGIAIERSVSNNKYNIEYDVIYISPEGDREENGQGVNEAMMVLDGTTYEMEVVDGVKYVTVKFKQDMHSAMENYRFKVDGKDAEFELVEGTTSYRIKLGENASSEVEASMYVPAMGRDVSFALAPKGEIKTEKKLKDGEYKTTNTIDAHIDGFQKPIRSMANEDSIIKVENGNISFILGFTPYSHAKDFAATSGEETLNVTKGIQDEAGNPYAIEVDMPSLDAELTIALTLPYGTFYYDTTLDTSVVEYEEVITQEIPEVEETPEVEQTPEEEETPEVEQTLEIGKVYNSKIEITGTSETGMNMLQKYLDSVAKIEKVSEGNYDVTIAFTGADLMKDHTIYVNGNKVDHEVVSKSGDSISIKFRISDLNDSIKVGLYVIPMARNIDFGIKLGDIDGAVIGSTITEETTEATTEATTEELPQTGSTIDTSMIMGVGAIMMSAGVLGRRKRK